MNVDIKMYRCMLDAHSVMQRRSLSLNLCDFTIKPQIASKTACVVWILRDLSLFISLVKMSLSDQSLGARFKQENREDRESRGH